MHIYVDADACPVTDIVERIAQKFKLNGLRSPLKSW